MSREPSAHVRQAEEQHQEPATAYERMLDRHGLDCAIYACWKPIRGFVTRGRGEIGMCERHAREHGTPETTRWLES